MFVAPMACNCMATETDTDIQWTTRPRTLGDTLRFSKKLALVPAIVSLCAITACTPDHAVEYLSATYNARQCIIDIESRHAGMYTAGNDVSSAEGAYQWLDSDKHIWNYYLGKTEEFFQLRLTSAEEDANGARYHAASASPYTQDLVTAYALVIKPQNVRPWTHKRCYALIGTDAELRDDGPVNAPPPFIQAQIDAYGVVTLS